MKLLSIPQVLALSVLLAAGCTRPEEVPRPAQLLSKDEMARLLTQLHLLEARVETARLPPDSARALFLAQRKELFWKQNVPVDDSVFEHSYRYYGAHNKDLDEIYTVVVDSLSAAERRLGGANWAPPP